MMVWYKSQFFRYLSEETYEKQELQAPYEIVRQLVEKHILFLLLDCNIQMRAVSFRALFLIYIEFIPQQQSPPGLSQ